MRHRTYLDSTESSVKAPSGLRHRRYSILRNADLGDCTGGGLSAAVTSCELFWDCTRDEALYYCAEHNMNPRVHMYLHKRELWGEDHSFAEPLVKPETASQMFGGNYMVSDSGGYRFGNEVTVRPIPIHDRFEFNF